MREYSNSSPVFSESIEITEVTDPAHADNINAAPKQLLQNTLVLKQEIEKQQQVLDNCPEDVNEALETTKEEILSRIEELIDSAPEALDTFKEIADALGNDPNYAATILQKFSELSAAAYAQTITSYADMMANTVAGYLVSAVAVKDGINALQTQINAINTKLGTQVTYSISGSTLTITPK